MDTYAAEGLRTLFFAYKKMKAEEYNDWAAKYKQATLVLNDREY